MDLILYAIPVFLLLILMEFSYGLWCARNTYRLNDTINSLSMGTLSRLQALVIVGTSAGLYEFVATTFGLNPLGSLRTRGTTDNRVRARCARKQISRAGAKRVFIPTVLRGSAAASRT